jgi:diaminopimelate decarboxylase/aspartate kinase
MILEPGMPQTETVVLKFGGTSVASRERWDRIREIVTQRLEQGLTPFLVCSAISGISDQLESLFESAVEGDFGDSLDRIEQRHRELAEALEIDLERVVGDEFESLAQYAEGIALLGEDSARLKARIMAKGELMSTRMGAAFLSSCGLNVDWLDARESLKAKNNPNVSELKAYSAANCDFSPDSQLQETVATRDTDVFLTQGFIAANRRGETVLLGRGGSDTSASYFASKLESERLEIWTDVPGMFTANPHDIPSARLLKKLDYMEAQEMAAMGAEVLHPRAIDPAKESDIPLTLKDIERPNQDGTFISRDVSSEEPRVKAISAKENITLVSMETLGMWQEVGFLAEAFERFREHGLSVDMVATSETNVTATLDPMANALDDEVLESLKESLEEISEVEAIRTCSGVSLIGRRIRSILPELGPTLQVFDEERIHMVSQAANDLNLTFVVDPQQADQLGQRFHAEIFQNRSQDDLLGPSWEEITGGASSEFEVPETWWSQKRDRLCELADSAPLFVYDSQKVRQQCRKLTGMEHVDRLFFAMKSNNNGQLLDIVESEGIGFECVSSEEVKAVRERYQSIDTERIFFTPNFAPQSEYSSALNEDAWVTIDSLFVLENWGELLEGRQIFVRVDPGSGRGHHKYVKTGGEASKFGIPVEKMDRVRQLADENNIEIVGLHAHLGSGIKREDTWAETGAFLADLSARFDAVEYLNVGGGLPVPGKQGDDEVDLAGFDEALGRLKAANPEPEIWLEPGRFIVSEAGVLLARVTQLKTKGERRYVGLETGMNSLIRPALYGAHHGITNLTRLGESPQITADVVGPICESADVLGRDRRFPQTEEGDLFLIDNAGAYGRVMSSRYNMREPADEVVLNPI